MMNARRLTQSLLLASGLFVAASGAAWSQDSGAGEEKKHDFHPEAPPAQDWSFEGVFGTYNQANLQRGFQVYNEVCSACHGLRLLAYRNLAAIGYSPEEVKAIAAQNEVVNRDPDENGDMFTRPAVPSDSFRSPFPNIEAARAANGGAAPPDLSLLAKRTAYRANYPYGILTGYEDEPPADTNLELLPGQYFNRYAGAIAMAPPLSEGIIEYHDGTEATVQQMAYDVSSFLMWAAEPHMEDRKETGIKAILFLLVFTVILYAVKRKVWAELH